MPEEIVIPLVFDDTKVLESLTKVDEQMKAIEDTSGDLTDAIIKDMESGAKASEKFGDAVGDAGKSVEDTRKDVEKSSEELQQHRRQLIENIKNYKVFGVSINDIQGKLQAMRAGLRAATVGTSGMSKAMKVLKVAIASTGIGILVVALGSLVAFFTKSADGAEKLRVVFAQIGSAVSVVVDRFAAIGRVFAADGIIAGIKGIFTGWKGVNEELREEIRLTKQLEEQAIRLEKAEILLQARVKSRRADIKQLRQIGEDITKSDQERIKALEEAGEIEREVIEAQIDLKEQQIKNALAGVDAEEKFLEIQQLISEGALLSDAVEEDFNKLRDLIGLSATTNEEAKELIEEFNTLAAQRQKSTEQQIRLDVKLNSIREASRRERLKAIEEERKRISDLQKSFEDLANTLTEDVTNANLELLEGGERIRATYELSKGEIEKTRKTMLDLFLELNKGKGTVEELKGQFNETFGGEFTELLQSLALQTRKELSEVDPLGQLDTSAGAKTLAEQTQEAAKLAGKKVKVGFREGYDDELFEAIPVDDIVRPVRTVEDILLEIGGKLSTFYEEIGEEALNASVSIVSSLASVTQAQIEQQDALIDALNQKIDAQQTAVDEQLKLQEDGFANNLDVEQQYLEELQAQRDAAEAQRLALAKKAANQQLIIDAATQVSSLATGAAKIFSAEGSKGLLGVLFAASAIASMYALFAKAKAQAKTLAATPLLREGAKLQGPSHEGGGIPLSVHGNMYEAEGGEWLIGSRPSKEHDNFLNRLNSNEFAGLNLDALISKRETPLSGLVTSAMHTQNQRQTAESGLKWVILKDAYLQGSREIVKAIHEQPTAVNGHLITRKGNTLQRKKI